MERKRLIKKIFNTVVFTMAVSFILVLTNSVCVFAGSTSELNFKYAYDCQRDPAFPKKGDQFSASCFDNPLTGWRTFGTTTSGNWKLSSKGSYSGDISAYPGANSVLEDIITNTAIVYGISSTEMEVYELKDGANHIAYGVLCAITDDVVLFVGDTWGGGGGYVLSNTLFNSSDVYSGTVIADATGVNLAIEGIDGSIENIEFIDYDTFKTEAPTGTVRVSTDNTIKTLNDMKVHSVNEKTAMNQTILVNAYLTCQEASRANIVGTFGVYPRRDLTIAEKGSKQKMVYKLPKTIAANTVIYAQCYSSEEGAYLITGLVDNKGYATFNNYILRDAVTVTVFTIE